MHLIEIDELTKLQMTRKHWPLDSFRKIRVSNVKSEHAQVPLMIFSIPLAHRYQK